MHLAIPLICAAATLGVAAHAAVPGGNVARARCAAWTTAHLGNAPEQLAYTFKLGGAPSTTALTTWHRTTASRRLDSNRTELTTDWLDPASGLKVRCVAVRYADFPAVEWTVFLKNTGQADTPLVDDLRALDGNVLPGPLPQGVTLHHNAGSQANRSDYAPIDTPMATAQPLRFAGAGGRPTNKDMSYFNLASDREGLFVIVGWPGQWAADFTYTATGVQVRAGQEETHFVLHPGEEVRTPLMVLMWWQGMSRVESQNVWRRWMMAHGMPTPEGKLPPPRMFASSSRAYSEMIGANEANQIMHIDRYRELGLPLDCWWMDAGWYVQQNGWPQVGTWEPDPKRFPHGFKPISDHAHALGMKILVWFEPERVAAGTWLADNHPEWILGGKAGGLLNLGNPEAWHWLVEHIDKLIVDNGIDVYRQDFNIDPLSAWRAADGPDRRGITENHHVTGYLAYWDELRRRHPGMLIDSCASGGRRNDLETMRRSVPLWRSDYAYEAIGHQCMTYGISEWLPYHGTGTVATANAPYYGGGVTPVEPYAFWSNAAPGFGCGVDVREKAIDYAALGALFRQWREVSPGYYGDYYPLTPYTQDEAAWIAWQFHRPDKGDGFVQAFRRGSSGEETQVVRLHGLAAKTRYRFTTSTGTEIGVLTGAQAAEPGLTLRCPDKPGALVVRYSRAR